MVFAEIHVRYIQVDSSLFHIGNQVPEQRIKIQQIRISDKKQLFTSPSQGNIQFAVNPISFFFKDISSQEIQLIAFLNRESVNDNFPFASLIPFNGINRDVMKFF